MQITLLNTRGDTETGRQEPDEEMETVSIQPGQAEKVMKIGTRVEAEIKKRLVSCLRKYADVFAWSHDDMPGIDPAVACYKLAIRKEARPVRQKMRCFNQERYNSIATEVEKLLHAGFIK